MPTHLGRNDLCWCGSGKKFKRCHLGRENQQHPTFQQALDYFRKVTEQAYCLHPHASPATCRGTIVRAHTVQRSGGLSRIARQNHVYKFALGFSPSSSKPQARLEGIRRASTFTGFCNGHDTDIFRPIETQTFSASQQEAFLLSYRAICQEVYYKKAGLELAPYWLTMDQGLGIYDQIELQQLMQGYRNSITIGQELIAAYKARHDQMLLAADFTDVYYYVVWLSHEPQILCTGITNPEFDFAGNRLQSLSATVRNGAALSFIAFSLIATDAQSAAVFSWIGENAVALQLVRSLDAMPTNAIPHALVRYTFEFVENTFASPDWWEGLDDATRNALLLRADVGIAPLSQHRQDCLIDDEIRPVTWGVTRRQTNLII